MGYGVMVTLQILVLPFLVRVRVAQPTGLTYLEREKTKALNEVKTISLKGYTLSNPGHRLGLFVICTPPTRLEGSTMGSNFEPIRIIILSALSISTSKRIVFTNMLQSLANEVDDLLYLVENASIKGDKRTIINVSSTNPV